MPRSNQERRNTEQANGFLLYVEGPRDRDILRAWARQLSPILAKGVAKACVILGGRQPDRAVEHLEQARAASPQTRALCVLDRDDGDPPNLSQAAGLDFFTWSRRHIESYLLVPDAIRRSLPKRLNDGRVDRFFRDHLPNDDDEAALRACDAKRLLAKDGPLARAVGQPVAASRIARQMHRGEFHPDILNLFDRVRQNLTG